MVFPVLKETLSTDVPPGTYEIYVVFEEKGNAWASETIRVVEADSLPEISMNVMGLGLSDPARDWLARKGIQVLPFTPDRTPPNRSHGRENAPESPQMGLKTLKNTP